MKAVLVVLFITLLVFVNANQENKADDLVEGELVEEKLYRHARGICMPLTCNQLCFPRLGYCSYNSCHCS